jgi:hypothetical protein
VTLLSETCLNPHERFSIRNYYVPQTDRYTGLKCGNSVAVRKDIPHTRVNLPPLVSIEATEVCISNGKKEVLLAAVYKLPGRVWSEADVIKNKSLLSVDQDVKNHVWNSSVKFTMCETLGSVG